MKILMILLASARLTRLITTDWLGEWMIVRPVKKWALEHEGPIDVHEPVNLEILHTASGQMVNFKAVDLNQKRPSWRTKLSTGLDCSHCVGFWTTLLLVTVMSLPLPKSVATLRGILIGALAGSYIVGHLSAHLDT